MLYRVTIYRPNPYERCFEAKESWIVGNPKVAKLTALEKLPTAYETYYSAKLARLPYATIKPANDSVGHSFCVETPVCYVPSVGELGYTP